MNPTPLLQIAITIVYLLYVNKQVGITYSISNSWYRLREAKKKNYFNLWASVTGLLFFLYPAFDYPIICDFLYPITGLSLFSVSIADRFKEGTRWKFIHNLVAILTITLGITATCYYQDSLIPLGVFAGLILLIRIFNIPNKVFWIECSAVAIVGIGSL